MNGIAGSKNRSTGGIWLRFEGGVGFLAIGSQTLPFWMNSGALRELARAYDETVSFCWFAKELATGFDDFSYAMSFELVGTQRFDATTDCPAFGFETSRGFVVSAGLTSRGNTRRRFDL
ncbi:hypothetical protein F511_33068 [Dorcoceras hygrometricum]|uniref:Uncharacterized protein n=1 Tax=Dorcoceras hygrometricum TaxID=472368 RepID=A0A2Z7BCP2_9LAMI|nr:hypothetical protein F511_33068 [Dorcoceras hygrometricum]